ncbi:MAG: exodeoxyribonuclease III [Vicinamibacterales bacterium]
MKIATWNVNGLRAREAQLVNWLESERPDIVCLQEIKASRDQIPPMLQEAAGYWCHWHGERAYSGVALLVRAGLCGDAPHVAAPSFDFETRIVASAINGVIVASVYVPNGGKDLEAKFRFLESLEAFAEEHRVRGEAVVLCGDLNIAHADIDVHPKERKPRAIGQLPAERAAFDRLLARGLIDVCRSREPGNEGLFTWWAPWRNLRQRNIGWRIDYVLASDALAARAVSSTVRADVGTSDHAPVVVDFSGW